MGEQDMAWLVPSSFTRLGIDSTGAAVTTEAMAKRAAAMRVTFIVDAMDLIALELAVSGTLVDYGIECRCVELVEGL
jgi:DNA/RNA-binding domain of Phe-tRNA-synthetase-like protein